MLSQYGERENLLNLPPLLRESTVNPPRPFKDGEWVDRLPMSGKGRLSESDDDYRFVMHFLHEDDTFMLCCSSKSGLWLEVNGSEHPFNATGHFPVLAGYSTSGKELYVARLCFNSYTYVSDGARSVWNYACRAAEYRFQVLVLRHNPCDVGPQMVPKGAKFQTGPVYWIHDEDEHSKPLKEGRKAILVSDFEGLSVPHAELRVSENDADPIILEEISRPSNSSLSLSEEAQGQAGEMANLSGSREAPDRATVVEEVEPVVQELPADVDTELCISRRDIEREIHEAGFERAPPSH